MCPGGTRPQNSGLTQHECVTALIFLRLTHFGKALQRCNCMLWKFLCKLEIRNMDFDIWLETVNLKMSSNILTFYLNDIKHCSIHILMLKMMSMVKEYCFSRIWIPRGLRIFFSSLPHFLKKVFIYLFLEREEGREKESERNSDVREKHQSPTWDKTGNPGTCPDWEWNCQPFALWGVTQPTEPHQPGFILRSLCFEMCACMCVCVFSVQ